MPIGALSKSVRGARPLLRFQLTGQGVRDYFPNLGPKSPVFVNTDFHRDNSLMNGHLGEEMRLNGFVVLPWSLVSHQSHGQP